jgi:hypothetical protein
MPAAAKVGKEYVSSMQLFHSPAKKCVRQLAAAAVSYLFCCCIT